MGWLLDAWREASARRDLASLRELVGSTGLAAAEAMPGLRAEVDQHAAALRDILSLGGGRPGVVELVAYARGVCDVAQENGWHPPPGNDLFEWSTADWISLRLLAVCLLATSTVAGVPVAGVPVADGDADPPMFP